jgi:hypothetical protein
MCKELSQGLSLLSTLPHDSKPIVSKPIKATNGHSNAPSNTELIRANKTFGQLSSYAEDLFTNVQLPVRETDSNRVSPSLSLGSNATSNSLSATKSNTSTQSSVKQTDLDLFNGFDADFDKHFDASGQPIPKDSPKKFTCKANGAQTNSNHSSLNESFTKSTSNGPTKGTADQFDPFDAEWVSLAERHNDDYIKNTNPFLVPAIAVKAFEIKM